MKNFVIAGAVVAAALGLGARRVEGPRVAVVDMSRLMKEHRQSKDEQALIEQWRATNQKLLDTRQSDYKHQVEELDQFKEGSDEYRKRGKDLRVKKFELENEAKSLQEEFEQRIGRSMAAAHGRVMKACQTYLEANDLEAMMQYASSPVSGEKSSEVIPEIVVRTVVAHRKSVDATDAVLAILDAAK